MMRKWCLSVILLLNSVFGLVTAQTPFINIFDSIEGCIVPYDKTAIFNIRTEWSSDAIVSNMNTPFVGCLDGDDIPEIVCFAYQGETTSRPNTVNRILVFNGQSHALLTTIPTVSPVSAFDAAGYGLVKLPSGKGLIVTVEKDGYLRAYDFTSNDPGTPYWRSNQPVSNEISAYASNIGFADFNNDGIPEVYVRNRIYNAVTGRLLATATGGSNLGESYSHYSHLTQWKIASPIACDIVGDSRAELILGNEIYDVQITNTNGTSGNSVTLLQSISPPAGVVSDGHAQVADFNLDGHLDVFISNRDRMGHENGVVAGYVWDVTNNQVSAPFIIMTNNSGKSIPLISDINNDGVPEVIIQCGVAESTTDKLRAYHYDATTNSFSLLWSLYTDEDSYSNTMTSFDFNQDGLFELLVCDQSTVRIVNGSGISHLTHQDTIPVYVISSFAYTEITIMQYPVIADVNNDGCSEFISVGSHRLNIFTAAKGAWAASRPVWNQYMYNVTNVNNDLTIPTTIADNAVAIMHPQDSVLWRPFNNCLQQVCSRRGVFAADAVIPTQIQFTTQDNELCATVSIENQGDLLLRAPYYLTLYANSLQGEVIGQEAFLADLEKQTSTTTTICLSTDALCEKHVNKIVFSINDKGHGIAQNGGLQPECELGNNVGSLYLGDVLDTIVAVARCANELPYEWRGKMYDHAGTYYDTIVTNQGCERLCELRLIVFPIRQDTINATICEGTTYQWHSNSYARDTLLSDTTQSIYGCDSISWLNLHIVPAERRYESYTICTGETVSIYGKTYNEEGIFNDTLPAGTGCDKIIQITIKTKKCPGSPDDSIPLNPYIDCDTIRDTIDVTIPYDTLLANGYLWFGKKREHVGIYQDTTLTKWRCDSIGLLKLRATYTDSMYVCGKDTAIFTTPWGEFGVPRQDDCREEWIHKTAEGENLVRAKLCVTRLWTDTIREDTTLCYGSSIQWHGMTIGQSKEYQYAEPFTRLPSCDSVVYILQAVVKPPSIGTNDTIVCRNELPILWEDSIWTDGGVKMRTLTNAMGCDSVVTLTLYVNEPTMSDTTATACEVFTWHGVAYSRSGDYEYQTTNAAGCDSTRTLHLTILPVYHPSVNLTVCNQQLPYTWNGIVCTQAGDYTYPGTTSLGCDSIVTLHLAVDVFSASDTAAAICRADLPYIWHGKTLTDAGSLKDTVVNSVGCDSIITLTLTVNDATSGDTTAYVCAGDDFSWYGTIAHDGDKMTFTNSVGCDSIVTLHLITNNPTSSDTTATACDSFTWRGVTYTRSGDYDYHLTNAAGCDSIRTLHLTIEPCCPDTIHNIAEVNICDTLLPYTWTAAHTLTLDQAGEYSDTLRNDDGCDSILYFLTLTTYTCCAPMEATMQVPDVCADDASMEVTVTMQRGAFNSYRVHYTNAPGNAMPFCDTVINDAPADQSSPVTLTLPVPHDAADRTHYPRPDTYGIAMTLYDACGDSLHLASTTFDVLFPSWLLDQHWDDVIAILNDRYNGGYTFSDIRWIRDGEVIPGERELYIYLPHQLWTTPEEQHHDYAYQALLTRADDGKSILTCPMTPYHIDSTNVLTEPYVAVAPTIVSHENPVVHVMTNTQGTYWIYSLTGKLLRTADYEPCDHEVFDIRLFEAQTMYILVFTPRHETKPLKEKYRAVKVMVE